MELVAKTRPDRPRVSRAQRDRRRMAPDGRDSQPPKALFGHIASSGGYQPLLPGRASLGATGSGGCRRVFATGSMQKRNRSSNRWTPSWDGLRGCECGRRQAPRRAAHPAREADWPGPLQR